MPQLDNSRALENLVIGAIILLFGLLAFFAGRWTAPEPYQTESVVTRYDTLIVERTYPPDTVTINKPRIVFRTDTVLETDIVIKYRDSAWTASDEVITAKSDTVRTDFLFPEMIFKHRFNYSPDSSKIITINIEKTIVRKRAWWEAPALLLGGAAVGYGLGRIP